MIDPGQWCAVRIVFLDGRIEQQLFDASGLRDHTERYAYLAACLSNWKNFCDCSKYFIESQHQKNVIITEGMLRGVIAAIRQPLGYDTNRNGKVNKVILPYTVHGLDTSWKTAIIVKYSMKTGDIKADGIKTARILASDPHTIELLDKTGNDDVADTVCYAQYVIENALYV